MSIARRKPACGRWRNSRRSSAADFGARGGLPGFTAQTLEDRWILSRFNRVAQEIDDALEAYRFHEAAHVVYHFFWGEYCDWYLELIKPRLARDDREQARAAFGNLVSIFEGALRLLSPFMPFITEELWHAVYDGKPPAKSIALAAYPQADRAQIDADAETEMAILQDLIVSVRNIRAELKVEPKQKLPIEIFAERGRSRADRAQSRSAGAAGQCRGCELCRIIRWPKPPVRAARRASMCGWSTSARSTLPPNASA